MNVPLPTFRDSGVELFSTLRGLLKSRFKQGEHCLAWITPTKIQERRTQDSQFAQGYSLDLDYCSLEHLIDCFTSLWFIHCWCPLSPVKRKPIFPYIFIAFSDTCSRPLHWNSIVSVDKLKTIPSSLAQVRVQVQLPFERTYLMNHHPWHTRNIVPLGWWRNQQRGQQ